MPSRLAAVLRAELASRPGRWRDAAVTALGTSVALGVAVALQRGLFVAPVMAYIALQPTSVCTWRNLIWRVLLCAGAAVVVIHVGGIAVQLPWLPGHWLGRGSHHGGTEKDDLRIPSPSLDIVR